MVINNTISHINRHFKHLSEKKKSFFMAKQSYTLSDKVLYDDASLYIAKEGEKLYFNFKKELVETYNVLEAVAILINQNKFSKLPIWKIKISDIDRQVDSVACVFYWLCHIYEIENDMNIKWTDHCEHFVTHYKPYLFKILTDADNLDEIKNGIAKDLNFDKMYSQLLRYNY